MFGVGWRWEVVDACFPPSRASRVVAAAASLSRGPARGGGRGEAGVVGVVCGAGEDGSCAGIEVWVAWGGIRYAGFFGERAAVGHGVVVVVGLACESTRAAATTTAEVENAEAKGQEEYERYYDCCCDFAGGWAGVVASVCCLQRTVCWRT